MGWREPPLLWNLKLLEAKDIGFLQALEFKVKALHKPLSLVLSCDENAPVVMKNYIKNGGRKMHDASRTPEVSR